MATVFYTRPDGAGGFPDQRRQGRRGRRAPPEIWSVPLPEPLHGKTVGDAFDWYADSEALVIGVYRNVKKRRGTA